MTPEQVASIAKFMIDYAKTHDKVPSVKTIAKGVDLSIGKTRKCISVLEDMNFIRRTVHGFAPPRVVEAPVAEASA